MKYGDIVIFNNEVGKIISKRKNDTEEFHFLPAAYGRYYIENLAKVTDEDVKVASLNDKIEYIKKEFVWGDIRQVINIPISNIQIICYKEKNKDKELYHAYIDFEDTNISYETMDSALVGTIGYKYEGANGKAAMYFSKMIDMS